MTRLPDAPINLVTVSREFGAGGSDMARALGARLQWPVLDHEIVHLVAQQLSMKEETVAHFEEHMPSLLARIATVLILPRGELYSFPQANEIPSHDIIAAATHRVIEAAGKSPPLIVVGHGAQCIFGAHPDALHVRVVAPFSLRVSHLADRMQRDEASATALVRRADHDRQSYVRRYFHRDWNDALLYDLQFNTAGVGAADASELVARLIESRVAAA